MKLTSMDVQHIVSSLRAKADHDREMARNAGGTSYPGIIRCLEAQADREEELAEIIEAAGSLIVEGE